MDPFVPLSSSDKQQLLLQSYEQFDEAVSILDADLRYLSVNSAYEKMMGYAEKLLIGRPLGIYTSNFLSDEERELLSSIRKRLKRKGFYENEFSMPNRFDDIIECHITYRRVCVGETVYYIGIIRNILPIVTQKNHVTHLLNYNQLTNLPNRKVFLSETSELLIDSYQEVVVVRINIDRYRMLANTLGPSGIDTLIKDFVTRVEALELKNLYIFSHFGGDDFALLFEYADAQMVRNELDILMQMCERPFVIADDNDKKVSIYCHISVGVSYFPEHGHQLNDLLIKAEKALQYTKQNGGDDISWYDCTINNATADSLQLESELRLAIENSELVPFYQPEVDLNTGFIIGFEALVRWQHPVRGLLKPFEFMDAIVTYKLSFELFCQMMTQITKQLSKWRKLGFSHHVSVNADVAEFAHPYFFSTISRLITDNDIEPNQLHIEMTESSLIQRHANVQSQLKALKNIGVCLALDDFGTGYASLSYLQEYPFDFLKIDKCFVGKIDTDTTQRAIVKAILDLSLALDMQVIAEGVETQSQRDLLAKMGCKYAQGYWFGKAVSASMATKILTHQRLGR
ncbi:putative bifunctional diguanylate cyclase/phosphodiesterase [Psychrobacter sp. T6-1]|uniref:putative bifunctional diguanylate cyclase/phosphodiesterase n=1 Tax=Psychrobacter sp. T6-1 TaxID=3457447 RepID=UPI003FD5E122